MKRWLVLPLVAASYLLGSVSFSVLLVRRLRGTDPRTLGSGNPGATNTVRVAGLGAGAAVLALDVAKGAAPVLAARAARAPEPVRAACATAAVAGHVYPLFFGFRGGKGVATGFGALAALAPRAGAASAVVFAGTAAATGYVSAGSMAGALSFPLLVAADRRWRLDAAGRSVVAAASAIGVLVLARHGGNLRRLRTGSERRWRDRGPDPDARPEAQPGAERDGDPAAPPGGGARR